MSENGGMTKEYTPLQAVKRHFFAMRNGIVADTLRKAGSPFRFIFGLNLPQIVEAAQIAGTDRTLAEQLWANINTRESMLLAPMIMPRDSFSHDDACRWIGTVPAVEVADILCHRLLRHMPYAAALARELAAPANDDMTRYTAGRLAVNIIYNDTDAARDVAAMLSENPGPLAASIQRQLEDRIADL